MSMFMDVAPARQTGVGADFSTWRRAGMADAAPSAAELNNAAAGLDLNATGLEANAKGLDSAGQRDAAAALRAQATTMRTQAKMLREKAGGDNKKKYIMMAVGGVAALFLLRYLLMRSQG